MPLLGRQAFLCGVRPGTAAATAAEACTADRHAAQCPGLQVAEFYCTQRSIDAVGRLLSINSATSVCLSQRTELDLAVLPVCRRPQRCDGLHNSVRPR